MNMALSFAVVLTPLVVACNALHLQMEDNVDQSDELTMATPDNQKGSFDFDDFTMLLGDSETTFEELAEKINEADTDALIRSYGPLPNELRYTPLMYLAEHGEMDLVKHLLKKVEETPVDSPSKSDDSNSSSALVVEAIAVCSDKTHHNTPLDHAAIQGHADVVEYLCEKLGQCDERDKLLYTMLTIKDEAEKTVVQNTTDQKVRKYLENLQNDISLRSQSQ